MPDSLVVYLLLGGLVLLFGAWAGWRVGARRARRPKPVPASLWLCATCRSFNEPERAACYRCHAVRPVDARSVVPDPEFHLDQHFGRAIDDGWRGPARPRPAATQPAGTPPSAAVEAAGSTDDGPDPPSG